MKTITLSTFVLMSSLLPISVLQGLSIHVPADSVTIQAGIDGAVHGDTVLVSAGVYTGPGNRDIDFHGKKIVVMSDNGPEETIIDCEGSPEDPHRGFLFHHTAEDSNAVLQGLTITNGWSKFSGGGIFCDHSSPTIRGNIITGNATDDYAGGGGIAGDNSSMIIVDNLIIYNTSANSGGGIFFHHSSPTIRGNVIAYNTTSWSGTGGGIHCGDFSSATIMDNIILGNSTSERGGGIYCSRATASLTGNVIAGNSAEYGGGFGAWDCQSNIVLDFNTFYGNSASERGGGILCTQYTHPTLSNSIAWADTSEFGGEIHIESGSMVTAMYSDIDGGYSGVGNINEDPLFSDPMNGDYSLTAPSPCVDSADPERPNIPWGGSRRDMGALEFDQGFYFDGQNIIHKPIPIQIHFIR